MKQFIKYIALIVCACSCWSCMDDEIGQEIDYSNPATVKLSIDFSDMQVVTPGTRSAGDAIGKITNVCVLFYKADGTLAMEGTNPIYHYATIENPAESASFTKKVPVGAYKVFAVANMGNLVTDATYQEKVKTWIGLKSISLAWNNYVAANNQMFGFFTFSSGNNSIDDAITANGMSNVAPTSFDAPELSLSGNKTLYAKLYRTVAKVTVAFDGSGLNSNVFVTINSIRLGNLPAQCPLWIENSNVKDTVQVNEKGGAQSEILTDAQFGLLRVTNRGADESLFPKDAHSPTGPSLFMFENRQGLDTENDYTNKDKDKIKARNPFGAFIEIEAQYANESTGSNGKIIYRYMLGEDIPGKYNNYNLTRNRHYRVTLMLQKSGKESPYWRVQYTENPSINLATEVNISYRQSAALDIPFTVSGEVESVKAQIVENPWYDMLTGGDASVSSDARRDLVSGFLVWKGAPSSNSYYGANKTNSIDATYIAGDQYKLEVQTEALGFFSQYAYADPDASFSGYNNFSNPRTAKIKVTVKYKSGEIKTAEVKVVQVPRIVNPIAIYRNWNSMKEFKIRLLNERGTEVESYGPWRAEVKSGGDWIRIKSENGTYGTTCNGGDAGGAIRFYYKPETVLGSANQNRCGVIVVYFSNYKVEHRIYVRQGDAPMAIGNSSTLWTSYNYLGVDKEQKTVFTKSPMEEGAWLKKGNSKGFLANNPADRFEAWFALFSMSDGSRELWDEIKVKSDAYVAPGYELPSQRDIENLISLKELSGIGIGYDDNAEETLAFDENAQFTNPTMGKRGMAICDSEGRNLFFPIGKRGYGRRRSDINYGGLHYANCNAQYEIDKKFAQWRPALVGLNRAMGAIYRASGFYNFSLNYSVSNIEGQNADNFNTDACLVRLVKVPNL